MNGKKAKEIRKYARVVNANRARYRKLKENYQRGDQGQKPKFETERKRRADAGTHVMVMIQGRRVVSSLGVGRDPRRIWREGEPIHVLHPNRKPPKGAKAAEISGPAN